MTSSLTRAPHFCTLPVPWETRRNGMNTVVRYKVNAALMFGVPLPFSDNHTAIADTSVVQALCRHYVIYLPLATTF